MSTQTIPSGLKSQLQQHGYSEGMLKELWKWYDSSKKKGVASF
jgi:hypothetical protein